MRRSANRSGRALWPALGWTAAAAVAVALALALLLSGGPPDGPVPVAWNRAPCAYCRMLVGDPAFAAQLQTRDGEVYVFDDPGCLLRFEAERAPDVHAVYFHHSREARWIPRERVGFVPADGPTPMGYGLAAVERADAEGALAPPAALAAALARDAARRQP